MLRPFCIAVVALAAAGCITIKCEKRRFPDRPNIQQVCSEREVRP